jgi:orotidine-5'-phosphate decarboxylase
VLCRTSNPGSADLQEQLLANGPLFEIIAMRAREWNVNGNIGLVVGATYPDEVSRVRQLCPDMPLLIPGVGKQGGDLASAVRYGVDSKGQKAIISSSRQVTYASQGDDFAQAAREAASGLRDEINRYLKDV